MADPRAAAGRTPLISFCIPTIDGRRDALANLIDSVLAELDANPSVAAEICISDKASADGTEAMVAEQSGKRPQTFVYRRREGPLEGQRDIFAAVELGRGEYVWMLGSDDALAPGALARVTRALAADPALAGMTLNRASLDARLEGARIPLPEPLLPRDPDRPRRYDSYEEVLLDCGILQSDISLNVFRRRGWAAAVASLDADPIELSPYWAHMVVIGRIVQRDPRWLWDPEIAIRSRSFSSSWVQGFDSVFEYQLKTTADLAGVWSVLAPPRLRRELMRRWYHGSAEPRTLIDYKLRASTGPLADLRMLIGFGRHFWFMRDWWLGSVPVLLCPTPLLRRRQRQS